MTESWDKNFLKEIYSRVWEEIINPGVFGQEMEVPVFRYKKLAGLLHPNCSERLLELIGQTFSRLPEEVFFHVVGIKNLYLYEVQKLGDVIRLPFPYLYPDEPGTLVVLNTNGLSDSQIIGLLAHEIGHLYRNDLQWILSESPLTREVEDACDKQVQDWGFEYELGLLRNSNKGGK